MLPDGMSKFFMKTKNCMNIRPGEWGKYAWINTFTTRKGCHPEISQNIANFQDRNINILPKHFWLVKSIISNYLNEQSY